MAPEVETHLVNAVLTNGARYYVDHAHPEYSTPECVDALEVVRFDRVRSVGASAPSIRCRIKVVVSRLQSVVVEGNAHTVGVAFGDALDASSRWVNHLRERRRRVIRRRPPDER